jgi:hypothetical protein
MTNSLTQIRLSRSGTDESYADKWRVSTQVNESWIDEK